MNLHTYAYKTNVPKLWDVNLDLLDKIKANINQEKFATILDSKKP